MSLKFEIKQNWRKVLWNPFSDAALRPQVQRLVAGGKRAALPLVARGQLRVEGDLGQLEDIGLSDYPEQTFIWGWIWGYMCRF